MACGLRPQHLWQQSSQMGWYCTGCNTLFKGHAIVIHIDHDPDRKDHKMPPELRSDRPWRLAVRATTSFQSLLMTVAYFEQEADAHEARDVVEAAVRAGMKYREIANLINTEWEGTDAVRRT